MPKNRKIEIMDLIELKKKKILILGQGQEGIDAFLFLSKIFPNKKIGLADRNETPSALIKKDKRVKWHLGKDHLCALRDYDLIIKSPGVPVHLPEVEQAYKEGKIFSPTQIFFDNCPGLIVGITGTKGKSTTTALIYKILIEGGIKAHLVGNIGKPVLSFLLKAKPRDVYVYELSCHQLYRLKKSPAISVFLNIYPEHLDYYKNFNEYFNAKKNITLYQGKKDYFIFNLKDKNVAQIRTFAKKIPINIKNLKNFFKKPKNIPLKGEFNLFNIAAAIEVGKIFGVSQKNIAKAIKHFKPLPHRLECIGTYRGIKFYDDALSTIPETAIAALVALGRGVETIILGGHERNLDFKKLAKKILMAKIKTVILFPATGQRIWKKILQLSKGRVPEHFFVDNMASAVKIAYQKTGRGKICLLSCASPSFGIFRDYREKGKLFRKYVKKFAAGNF